MTLLWTDPIQDPLDPMPYARRVDTNHAQVIDALRRCGWMVWDSSRYGHGFFDAIAIRRGRVVFIEIKDGSKPPSARKLTADEIDVHRDFLTHGATVVVVSSVDQAIAL
jgi:hypothetical protein